MIFRIILSTDFFSSQLYDGKKHVNGHWIYSINLLYVWQTVIFEVGYIQLLLIVSGIYMYICIFVCLNGVFYAL